MTTRIDRRFAAIRQEGRAALLTFTMACDPDFDTSLAIAKVMELAPKRPKDHLMVVNLSGRGDKDLASVEAYLEGKK